MLLRTLLLIATVTLFSGCTNKTGAQAQTQASFSNPEQVGTLPDGRKVYMVTRVIPFGLHDHYIYYVENGGTTVNHNVSAGKSTYQTVVYTAP